MCKKATLIQEMSKISLPWEDDTPSHTLPSLSRFVPSPPPPPPHWEILATPVFVLNGVLLFLISEIHWHCIRYIFFFFLGGGVYFFDQCILRTVNSLFLHTLSSGFKQGQFVCVLRAVQCVLSALSAKVEDGRYQCKWPVRGIPTIH